MQKIRQIYEKESTEQNLKLKSKKDMYRIELEKIIRQNEEKRLHDHVGITKEEITLNK